MFLHMLSGCIEGNQNIFEFINEKSLNNCLINIIQCLVDFRVVSNLIVMNCKIIILYIN